MNRSKQRLAFVRGKNDALFWSADYRLSLLLVFLVLEVFVLSPILRRGGVGGIVGEVATTVVFVTGTLRMVHNRSLAMLAVTLAVATSVTRWLARLELVSSIEGPESLLTAVMLMFMACVILVEVIGPGPTNLDRILGAVAAYLLIALAYANGYLLIETLSPGALQIPDLPGGPVSPQWSMTYFSFSTLSTVGYGNVTIVHPIAQSMAMLEAMTGQLYPAILIGRLVGDWASRRLG